MMLLCRVGAALSGVVMAQRYANELNKTVLVVEKSCSGKELYIYWKQLRRIFGSRSCHSRVKVWCAPQKRTSLE